jgi:3D (Asp-Asp-Asp) domain-containing protein
VFNRSKRILAVSFCFLSLLLGLGAISFRGYVPAPAVAAAPPVPQPVFLSVGGQVRKIETTAKTVGALLEEQQITLTAQDKLSKPIDAQLSPYTMVKVTRRTEQVVTRQVSVPFETVKHEDESLDEGDVQTIQEGAEGEKNVTEIVYYEDGQPVDRVVLDEKVVKEPVNEIVALGTGHVVYRGERRIRYSKVLTMMSTGYSAKEPGLSDYTATGMLARYGVVAVDPSVIPLGTRLYIDGYGFAIAADTGSAIKGMRIDLCYDTLEEANAHGVQYHTVYILKD